MGWSAELRLERLRARMAEAEREHPTLPRSTRQRLSADQLDHLDAFCNHRTEDERARCACSCHRRPSSPPTEYRGPRYRYTQGERG